MRDDAYALSLLFDFFIELAEQRRRQYAPPLARVLPEGWLKVSMETCEHWHRIGRHDSAKCPLHAELCAYARGVASRA